MHNRLLPAALVLALLVPAVELDARRDPEETIDRASVLAHLEFLASDALNGRGSGTRDEWIAATYIASHLRRLGLEPLGDAGGFVQEVAIERVEAEAPPRLRAGSLTLTHGREMIVASLRGGSVTGPLVTYRQGEAPPSGAFVLVPSGTPPPSPAATRGAAAVMALATPDMQMAWEMMAGRLPAVSTRLQSSPPASTAAQPLRMLLDRASHEAMSTLPGGTPVTLSAQIGAPRTTHTWNVLGRLPGRDAKRREEVILLSAHLDHLGNRSAGAGGAADTIYNGADDDASGAVAVLELAEALTKEKRPRRSVVFVWFGSEEAGGWGAREFLATPPVPLTSIVANLEFEMIARPDRSVAPRTLWLTGFERSTLGPELARRGARLVQDPHPEQNFFERSDNIQLARRGVIAQTVSSYGLHDDYHQPTDEVGTVDLTHMTDAIRSMYRPVRWLADSKYRPEWREGMKP